MKIRGSNPGSHSAHENSEPLAAYADVQPVSASAADVDWQSSEFDRIAEQTLGGSSSA